MGTARGHRAGPVRDRGATGGRDPIDSSIRCSRTERPEAGDVRTLTLQVAKGASVTNQSGSTKTENIVVSSKGRAVYTLSGDTTTHQKCTKANGCFSFWPPVTVSSAKNLSKAAGIKGKLGTFKNHGVTQLTLNGQPLYYFTPDLQAGNKHQATGDELKTFGSIWHIVKASGSSSSHSAPSPPMQTTSTTSTNPYGY